MNKFHLRLLIPLSILTALLCGCTALAPKPTPTPQPTATATPVPPTATPSPEDLLEQAWQAFEDGDYETAEEIAKDVRTQSEKNGTESGEAWALLGMIELETGSEGTALYHFDNAQELGYESEAFTSAMVITYASQIESLLDDIFASFDPDSILSDIHQAQEYLTALETMDPDSETTAQFLRTMRPEAFNPADYTETDFPINEIENLLEMLEGINFFNPNSTHFQELYELHPENPIILYAYGVQKLWNDEYREAVDLLAASVEIEPANHATWLHLGFAYDNLGWLQHAHDAYIHCLILNPENEHAAEQIAEMDWLVGWTDYGFQGMGFSIYHSAYESFVEVIDSTPEAGKMKMENDFLLIQITWETGELTQTQLQAKMINVMDANGPRFKSQYQSVDFGGIPMTYRDYSYRIIGSSNSADAVIVGGICDGTSYIFDIRWLDPEEDHEYLHWVMAIYLETFTCSSD